VARPLRTAIGSAIGVAALAGTTLALIFSGAANANPSTAGLAGSKPAAKADPPLTSFASVPLSTPAGTIQAVIYDGANTTTGGSLPLALTGFTVPAAPFTAQTTAVVADGQIPGNTFSFAGSGPALNDPAAFPGTGPCPGGWSFGCLWDNRNYDVSSTLLPGDASANATVASTAGDCLTWVAQVFATGPSAAFANAGYVAAGVGLRDQGSGTINIAGIPAGAYIARAYLYWANINPTDPGGAMQIDGNATASQLDGTDLSPCWPAPGSTWNIFAYSANVTPFVTGNGVYTLSGYPTGLTGGQDPWANASANPLMEGASLIVFFGRMTSTATAVSATEGAAFSGKVATFTEPDASAPASQYTATIDWGDSSTSSGTVAGPTGGPFTVDGSHTYTEEGSYPLKVKITDNVNSSNTTTATSTASVADAQLAASCATPTVSTAAFSGNVAALTDANPFATTADFLATINWGDASSSTGVVTGPTGGPFTVSGNHTYATLGNHTITTSIVDDGGSTATTDGCTVLTYKPVPFVIGDGNSANGTHVTFWGAQWWKLNTLSGGTAPASFKGFALTPPTPSCGTNWTTGPGNSPKPPKGPLPSFMGVIVTSKVSKSGSKISGDTVHMVVVKTNPGYSNNPGHAGRGTVVDQIC
jgi:hypothetical protein